MSGTEPEAGGTKAKAGWLAACRATAAAIDRWVGWQRIGVAVSVGIIGVAVYVLWHMLHDIKFDEVLRILVNTDPRHVALAAPESAPADSAASSELCPLGDGPVAGIGAVVAREQDQGPLA